MNSLLAEQLDLARDLRRSFATERAKATTRTFEIATLPNVEELLASDPIQPKLPGSSFAPMMDGLRIGQHMAEAAAGSADEAFDCWADSGIPLLTAAREILKQGTLVCRGKISVGRAAGRVVGKVALVGTTSTMGAMILTPLCPGVGTVVGGFLGGFVGKTISKHIQEGKRRKAIQAFSQANAKWTRILATSSATGNKVIRSKINREEKNYQSKVAKVPKRLHQFAHQTAAAVASAVYRCTKWHSLVPLARSATRILADHNRRMLAEFDRERVAYEGLLENSLASAKLAILPILETHAKLVIEMVNDLNSHYLAIHQATDELV